MNFSQIMTQITEFLNGVVEKYGYKPFIFVAAIIVGLVVVHSISKALKKAKRKIKSAINNSTLGQAKQLLNEARAVANEPPAPRQIQDMTNTYAELIKRDFPELDVREQLTRAENCLLSVFNAIESKDIDKLVNASTNLTERVRGTITDLESQNRTHWYNDIKIHNSGISKYTRNDRMKTITIEIALQMADYCEQDSKIAEGTKSVRQFKYVVTMLHVQDLSKMGDGNVSGANCPNCGAPITNVGGSQYCEFCGAGLTDINVRVWQIDSYRKA